MLPMFPRGVCTAVLLVSALLVSGSLTPGTDVAAQAGQRATGTPTGADAVYRAQCSQCHARELFAGMPARRIIRAVESGIMAPFAANLSRAEREAVSGYLGTADAGSEPPPNAFCSDRTVTVNDASASSWN